MTKIPSREEKEPDFLQVIRKMSEDSDFLGSPDKIANIDLHSAGSMSSRYSA